MSRDAETRSGSAPSRRDVARTCLGALALTFSFTPFVVLVPGRPPQALFVRVTLWAVVVVAAHALYNRRAGRPLAATWTLPRTWPSMVLVLAAAAMLAVAFAWPPSDRTHIDLLRITIVAVIGEEVLFRGLVWNLVATTAHRMAPRPDLVALAVTTALFAISHLQYHDFLLTAEATTQLGYTLVAGLVLGWSRIRTGGIVVPVLLHAIGNAALQLGRHAEWLA